MNLKYKDPLQKLCEIQQTIHDLHPFLQKLYPIAIVEDEALRIYDVVPGNQAYHLVKETLAPMAIPKGVRAAFPLESYDLRMACIITGEVFDDLAGYVTIFHEFIHCQQFETYEPKLKQSLGIAQKAQAAHDFMWEINHPFPYNQPDFVQAYASFLEKQILTEVEPIRKQLKALLKIEDFEYMVWQEWKEGFARFIENCIRNRLGLQENHNGKEQPFNRVVFYEGGSNYIKILGDQEPELLTNIERLFTHMLQID